MRKSLLFVIILLVLTALACGFDVSTANITDAKMAKDPDGNQPGTVFAQDDTFHCVVEVANAPDDTKVKAVWIAVEADGVEPDFEIGRKELAGGGTLKFSVSNSEGQLWPAGKYKVDLYLNDELDRTLDFEVEGQAVVEEPTATPEPTDTPEPEPTDTPEPTEESSTGNSGAGDSISQPTEEAEEAEPLPLQSEPYVHPSGAFTFAVPEGWKLSTENETMAVFGGNESAVGVVFTDVGIVLSDDQMQTFIDGFLPSFLAAFGDDYEILNQQVQSDDSIYVGTVYQSTDGDGDADFFFEQRETVIFVLYFVTTMYEEMEPTWNEIIDSYAVDPQAVQAAAPAAPAATPTSPPPPPTSTPAPAANPFAPQPGRSRLYVFNEYGEEITFTIAGQEHKIPTGTPDDAKPIDLDPGKYTYTVSIPGGAANGEVELGADQSWAVGVRGDGVMYNPFPVYP